MPIRHVSCPSCRFDATPAPDGNPNRHQGSGFATPIRGSNSIYGMTELSIRRSPRQTPARALSNPIRRNYRPPEAILASLTGSGSRMTYPRPQTVSIGQA